MTTQNDRDDSATDFRLRRIYRDVFDEQTPAWLDEAVMGAARRNLGIERNRQQRWLRPLAWAASVGLCVAVVLQVVRVPEPPASPLSPEEAAVAVHEAAVESREQKMGGPLREKSLEAAPAMADFPADAAVESLSAVPASRRSAVQASSPGAAGLTDCELAERSGPDAWLECIEALDTAGFADKAIAERERWAEAQGRSAPAED